MDNIKESWSNIENKRKFIAFVSIVVFTFIIFIILVLNILSGSIVNQENSNKDPNGPDEEYTQEQAELEKEFLEDDKESSRVSQLIDTLPYRGSYFSLDYDYGSLKFTLILLQGSESQGLQEYGDFIKTNGIDGSIIDQNLIKTSSSSL